MPNLSVSLLNLKMKPVADTRLENLERLIREVGTAERLAELCDLSPVYVSQIRSRAVDVKTGKPRNLGAKAARKLEAGTGKPGGWMDADHETGPGCPAAEWPFPRLPLSRLQRLTESQLRGIEDSMIEQANAFLRDGPSDKSSDDDTPPASRQA